MPIVFQPLTHISLNMCLISLNVAKHSLDSLAQLERKKKTKKKKKKRKTILIFFF
jgi:hypothetical protein